MGDTDTLHWSINSKRVEQPDFAKRLVSSLEKYLGNSAEDIETADAGVEYTFDVLPNFWRGYKNRKNPQNPDPELCIGMVKVKRKRTNASWHYSVEYNNTTSGEHLSIEFTCNDDSFRTITGAWHIQTTNSAGNLHNGFDCRGSIDQDQNIKLKVGSLELGPKPHHNSLPLTCNWALFDVIPLIHQQIKKSSEPIRFAILEDMEKLKPQNSLGFLDTTQIETKRKTIELNGYYLYGTGLVPTYYWLDTYRRVTIVATTFRTFVLREVANLGENS